MKINKRIDKYLNVERYKVGDNIFITSKIHGLKSNHKGVITKIDGEYHLVLLKGRKKGEEVELYRHEMKKA